MKIRPIQEHDFSVGVESSNSLKGQENLLLKNLQVKNPGRKRPIFVMENIFCWKVRYSKHQRNGFQKDRTFTRVFDFPPSDLMRPRYCRSVDARMRMQNALLLLRSHTEGGPSGEVPTRKLWCFGQVVSYERCSHFEVRLYSTHGITGVVGGVG